MARLDIKESTLKKLFALSGNRCAFPGCAQAVVNEHGDLIAEVCHIEAAERRRPAVQPGSVRRGPPQLRQPADPLPDPPQGHGQRGGVSGRAAAADEAGARGAGSPPSRWRSTTPRPPACTSRSPGSCGGGFGRSPCRFRASARCSKAATSSSQRLRASLHGAADGHATAIVGKAVHGLGGVGKTRLAIEYAWQHADEYTALLFVAADTPESLARNLAGLCGPAVLDLPEQHVPEEEPRRLAVLHWLREHPGWLLIVDNVDTPAAARAAEDLLAELHGGHVLLTGRLSNWSGRVEPLELDVLAVDDAVEFLLARTDARRRKTPDDAADARTLAVELGQLALALEQAGAYIAHHRLTLAGYLRAVARPARPGAGVV